MYHFSNEEIQSRKIQNYKVCSTYMFLIFPLCFLLNFLIIGRSSSDIYANKLHSYYENEPIEYNDDDDDTNVAFPSKKNFPCLCQNKKKEYIVGIIVERVGR